LLQVPVIPLDPVIEIARTSMLDTRLDCAESRWVAPGLVRRDSLGRDAGLIDAPVVPHPTAMRARGFLIQRGELLDPIEDGGWVDMDAAFG
jgi:hypothetical protein